MLTLEKLKEEVTSLGSNLHELFTGHVPINERLRKLHQFEKIEGYRTSIRAVPEVLTKYGCRFKYDGELYLFESEFFDYLFDFNERHQFYDLGRLVPIEEVIIEPVVKKVYRETCK